MVGIIDYGVGNLFSLRSSFQNIGQEVIITADPQVLRGADHVVLPGVGAFEDAANKLHLSGLSEVVKELACAGKPLMGICLGMQLLFEKSFEYGEHRGLELLQGEVVGMSGKIPVGLKIPHMGWNQLQIVNPASKLMQSTKNGDFVYFVHSFYAQNCNDSLAAVTDYGISITAAVEKDNIFGCQFHPEKSGAVGLNILNTFCQL